MRVLLVTPWFHPARGYGGGVSVPEQLAWGLCALGCDVSVLTTDAGCGELHGPVMHASGAAVRYCRRVAADSASPELLAALPAAVRAADVVHLHATYSFPTPPTLALCRTLGRPLVWTPLGGLLRWHASTRTRAKKLWELACRALVPSGSIVHAASEHEARACRQRLAGLRVAVVPHAVAVPPAPRPTPALPLSLLFFSRLHPSKGVERLLEACALARRRVPLRLTIAGSGERAYVATVRRLIARLALDDCVSLAGECDEAERTRRFAAAHALVLPSYHESFGLAAAEALAGGVPVIAVHDTPWDMLEREGCGLWVAGDPASLAAAIERLAGAPLDELGRGAHAFAARAFAREHVAAQMLALYRDVSRGT